MDELELSEDQVVTPVSVEELTRTLSPAQAASVLGQAIRSGGQFFATAAGDVVLEGRPGRRTHLVKGVRHQPKRPEIQDDSRSVDGVGAEPLYAVNVKA